MKRFYQVYMHLVWGTKHRSHVIRGEPEMVIHQAIRESAKYMKLVPICVNSAWNHTHSLLSWNPSLSLDEVVECLKNDSELAICDYRCEKVCPALEWQEGYAAFSVSPGAVERVKTYIINQKELHRRGKTVGHFEKWPK